MIQGSVSPLLIVVSYHLLVVVFLLFPPLPSVLFQVSFLVGCMIAFSIGKRIQRRQKSKGDKGRTNDDREREDVVSN
jgi:hypothetical protein